MTTQRRSSGAVAELGPNLSGPAVRRRVEAGDVAGEVEVRLGPLPDAGQPRPERVGDDVIGVADEDRAVPQPAVPGSLLEHLGVVGPRSARPPDHRRPASGASRRSRSSRRTRTASARGSRAGSGRRPRPRRRSPGRTARRSTTSSKTMKLLTRISSIRRIAWKAWRSCSPPRPRRGPTRWPAADAGWTRSPRVLQHPGDRVLGQPVDLEVRVELTQLVGDREVAAGVAEADRRGEVQRPAVPARTAGPRALLGGCLDPLGEAADLAVDEDRVAAVRPCPLPSTTISDPPVSSASRSPIAGARIVSSVPCTTATGQRTSAQSGSMLVQVAPSQPSRPAVVSTRVVGETSRAQATQSSICLVECGSGNISPKKNCTEVLVAALEPVVAVVLGPAAGVGVASVPDELVTMLVRDVEAAGGRRSRTDPAPGPGGSRRRAPRTRRHTRATPAPRGRRPRHP